MGGGLLCGSANILMISYQVRLAVNLEVLEILGVWLSLFCHLVFCVFRQVGESEGETT